jgi:hypothetical protein
MMRSLLLLAALPAAAALPTQEEALALAFPGAALVRREAALTAAQAGLARTLAGRDLPSGAVTAFEARRNGALAGVAFFETHRVRTQAETVMVAVSPEGRVLRVEVVAFREPQEYMARPAWLRQFDGAGPDVALGRTIKPLAGSTLTANALTDAARRALALHKVLYGQGR